MGICMGGCHEVSGQLAQGHFLFLSGLRFVQTCRTHWLELESGLHFRTMFGVEQVRSSGDRCCCLPALSCALRISYCPSVVDLRSVEAGQCIVSQAGFATASDARSEK